MKNSTWKDAAELIGVATIVMSLGLVAYEVRQNTKAIEQEAAATYASNSIAVNLFVAGSSDFSAIIIKAREGELSPEEQLRLTVFYRGVTQNWQNTHFQYLSGTLDEEFWESEWTFMTRIMRGNTETWRSYWEREKENFTEDFRKLVTKILEDR